jgi:hypothetical protein
LSIPPNIVLNISFVNIGHVKPEPAELKVQIPIISDGILTAVVFWFDLQMFEGAPEDGLSSGPRSSSHWLQGLNMRNRIYA